MNQNGFGLALFLIILPVVISFLIAISTLGLFLQNKTKFLHICRTGLLDIQHNYTNAMNSLFKLNPKAESLRLKEQALRVKIAAAQISNPSLLPLLYAKLTENISQQTALKIQQEYIIKSSEALAKTKLTKIKQELRSTIDNTTDTKLAVIGTPFNAIAKTFRTTEPFESQQAITISWKTRKGSYVTKWLQEVSSVDNTPDIHSNCTATISKTKDNIWVEKLGTVKF